MLTITQLQAQVIRSLAHPTRLRILEILKVGEVCVCDIMRELNLEQSNVSQHLTVLRDQGIVRCRKRGLKVFYSVNNEKVFGIIELINQILSEQLEESKALLREQGEVTG